MTDRVCRRKFCSGFACATLSTFLHAGNPDTNTVTTGSVTNMNKSIIGNFRFIDLFCGIGGFHQAMGELGGKCVFACDIDADCRKTYQRNYGLEPVGDITKVEAREIPSHDVLCAGFPCQAFSKAGNRLGFADKTKGTLFFDVVRILKHHQPPYALLENVRNLASHDGGNTWRVIYESLNDVGYNVIPEPIIFSPHYVGIPQHRERVFIMCVRKDVGEIPPFYVDEENIPKCTIDSILLDDKDIPNLSDYQLSQDQVDLINIWNEFIQNIKCKRLPGFPVWADCLKSIEDLEVQWGGIDKLPAWEQSHIRKNSALWEQNKEFIAEWLPRAQKCKLFFGAKAKLEWQAGQYEHPNMWDHIMQIRPSGIRVKVGTYYPALVAITQTSIVGKRKRFLTPRECARLQNFPDSFLCDENERQAYKQFGNSVNVAVVRLFGQYLLGDQKIREQYGLKNKPLKMPKNMKAKSVESNDLTMSDAVRKRRGRPRKGVDDGRQMRFF